MVTFFPFISEETAAIQPVRQAGSAAAGELMTDSGVLGPDWLMPVERSRLFEVGSGACGAPTACSRMLSRRTRRPLRTHLQPLRSPSSACIPTARSAPNWTQLVHSCPVPTGTRVLTKRHKSCRFIADRQGISNPLVAGSSPAGRAEISRETQVESMDRGEFCPRTRLGDSSGTVRGQLPSGHFGQFRNALVERRHRASAKGHAHFKR